VLEEAEAQLDAGDDVGCSAGNLLRLLAGRAHFLGHDLRFAQGVGRRLQLDAAQDVGGQRRIDIEELGHVVARQLHDVLFHRERDDGAVGRPCERVTIPRERLILDGDVFVAVDGRSVYALVLTHNGGTVAHAVKKISTVAEIIDELGSVGNESVATERASQVAVYAIEILRAFGHPPTGPIMIGTDNSANLTLGLGTATPGKAKHAVRRWAHIRAHVRQGNITLAKVDTASMPVDFMTKWKGKKQTDTAVAYLTNSKNMIAASAEASALETSTLETDAVPYFWNKNDTTMAIKLEPFVPIEMATHSLLKPLGLLVDTDISPTAQTERLDQLYTEYVRNMPAPDELQFDHVAFRKGTAERAQLTADRHDPFTFGIIAGGAITLYLGTGAKLYFVNYAIHSIEFKEARRIAGLAASESNTMDTDAPGWGRYEDMSTKDYDDVADDWMKYAETIIDRKRRAEQHERTARADDDDDDDPYGDPNCMRNMQTVDGAICPTPHPSKKCAKLPMLEVSALEADTAFMTMRSGIRKYKRPPPPDVVPPPNPVVPLPPVVAPMPQHVVPSPDTMHVDPKQVAARLDDNGLPGPSASHSVYYRDRCTFQTNHEGLIDSDDDVEIPAEYSFQYSDRSYEDQ
jgi:hypothetical protein